MNTTPPMVPDLCLCSGFFPSEGFHSGEEHGAYFWLSLSIEGETHALEDPPGNVPGGVQVSFKDQAEAHGIAAHGGRVHRRAQRVLQEGTAHTLSNCKQQGLEERSGFRNSLCLLEVLNSHYPENGNVLYVVYWGWEIIERDGGV